MYVLDTWTWNDWFLDVCWQAEWGVLSLTALLAIKLPCGQALVTSKAITGTSFLTVPRINAILPVPIVHVCLESDLCGGRVSYALYIEIRWPGVCSYALLRRLSVCLYTAIDSVLSEHSMCLLRSSRGFFLSVKRVLFIGLNIVV